MADSHKSLLQQEQEQDDHADQLHSGVLRIKDAGRHYFIPHEDVVWIEAAGDYSLLHTVDKEAVIRCAIKTLEADLPAGDFVRVHRSAIVSAAFIREIRMLHKGEAQIILTDNTVVRTSRSYRDVVQKLLDEL